MFYELLVFIIYNYIVGQHYNTLNLPSFYGILSKCGTNKYYSKGSFGFYWIVFLSIQHDFR